MTRAVTGAEDSAGVKFAPFEDVRAGNRVYTSRFTAGPLMGYAKRGLAIVTCMDSRIEPLGIVGMQPGDVKILRNAGARVTDDVLRTLVVATHLLGVRRVLVMPHTDCRMANSSESDLHAEILAAAGVDASGIRLQTVSDQIETLREDVRSIREYPLLAGGLEAGGAVYDVTTGNLAFIDV